MPPAFGTKQSLTICPLLGAKRTSGSLVRIRPGEPIPFLTPGLCRRRQRAAKAPPSFDSLPTASFEGLVRGRGRQSHDQQSFSPSCSPCLPRAGARRPRDQVEPRRLGRGLSHGLFAGAPSGEKVIIDGPCLSACTLVLSTVPSNRICVTKRAVLGFHAPRSSIGVAAEARARQRRPASSSTPILPGCAPGSRSEAGFRRSSSICAAGAASHVPPLLATRSLDFPLAAVWQRPQRSCARSRMISARSTMAFRATAKGTRRFSPSVRRDY